MNLKKRKTMKTKPTQTSRIGTESKKWTSHGGTSVGRGREGGKVQRINSINDSWKIDRGRVRIV